MPHLIRGSRNGRSVVARRSVARALDKHERTVSPHAGGIGVAVALETLQTVTRSWLLTSSSLRSKKSVDTRQHVVLT